MFFTNWAGPDILNPVANVSVSGKGKNGGWFGWPTDDKMEELRDKFVRATNADDQRKIAEDIQKRVMEEVTYIPAGQYEAPCVWRTSLKGVLDGPATPIFWNIEKTDA
jgi:peptide/nickel transport system substrate-binding protein